jgi:HSP20 family protein
VRRWVPALDVLEEGEEYVLRADLPGVGDDDVKVEVEEGVLTIAGKRQSGHEERKDGYHRVERFSGSFSRRLTLPEGVDPESIKAHFERGVLEVRIPKPEQRKPRRVAISVGEAAPAIEGKSSEVASSAGAGSDS